MFAEVILKRRLPKMFDILTYEVAPGISAKTGQTVIVPFGKTRTTGIITGLSPRKPDFKLKKMFGILEKEILLQGWQIELAKWISRYYLCPLSKVIPLFLPKKSWHLASLAKVKVGKPSSPIGDYAGLPQREHVHRLTEKQKEVLREIEKNPSGKFLLHGVTGSGKTEIYLRAAKKMLEGDSQVLFLVPEIALTPQLIDFVQNHFPDTPLTTIHSKLNDRERDRNWLAIFRKEAKIVIGSRSALFSPFQKLSLIVIDEEHEWTYKQEKMPRYHTRKVAEKMAELTGATLILGSATPDVETYYEAGERERLTLLTLPHRIAETPLPKTVVVDMREEIRKKNFSIFSDLLREKMAHTLAQKKQIILFINRRGIAPATLCRDCGFVARCAQCEVAMVLHRMENATMLICHHCGKREFPQSICPVCESHFIRSIGIGTEKVEEEIRKLFSLALVWRADSDTITKKMHYRALYEKMKNHEIDILVGTQMIAKGIDLPQVHLVGVILADTSLHFPDFRAAERTFQLLTQVSGRAGRREERGEVIIQTYNPEHYAISAASNHNYETFYQQEISVRKEITYPPFAKIIRLGFSHTNPERCRKEIGELENRIETSAKKTDDSFLRIASCPSIIPRLHGKHHWEIILRGREPEKLIQPLLPLQEGWKIDVDAYR